jgi:hypothetical protein
LLCYKRSFRINPCGSRLAAEIPDAKLKRHTLNKVQIMNIFWLLLAGLCLCLFVVDLASLFGSLSSASALWTGRFCASGKPSENRFKKCPLGFGCPMTDMSFFTKAFGQSVRGEGDVAAWAERCSIPGRGRKGCASDAPFRVPSSDVAHARNRASARRAARHRVRHPDAIADGLSGWNVLTIALGVFLLLSGLIDLRRTTR